MVQKWVRAATVAAFGVAAVVLAGGGVLTADDKDDKKPEKLPNISEIMKKAHKGTDSYLAKLKTAAKDGKWDDAKKTAKEQLIIADALAKNDPPKGGKESWEKLTKSYIKTSKEISEAAKKEDAKGVNDGVGAIQKSCMPCHSAHKG